MMKIENAVLVVGSSSEALPLLSTDTVVRAWRVPAEYRENGLFVAVELPGKPSEFPACDPQRVEYLGAIDYPADDAMHLQGAKRRKLAQINKLCDEQLAILASTYPEGEIKSWPQQVKETEALAADAAAPVPLLEAIASARGLTVEELASRVAVKMQIYAAQSGALIGRRQAAEDQIDAAKTLAELETVIW